MDEQLHAALKATSCSIERGVTMVRVLICDDNRLFLTTLESRVSDCLKQLGVSSQIHTYTCISEISGPILASCDIAFLDIDFKSNQYNGLDIARKIHSVRKDAVIIFVTNYIEYAPEGYEVRAFRYLLKKDISTKYAECIKQAIEHLNQHKETLKIKVNGEVIDINLKSILYIESQLRMVVIYAQRDREIKTYEC